MPDRLRAGRALVAGLAILARSAGCATVPTSGSVHYGRAVSPVGGNLDDADVRALPPGPRSEASIEDTIRGFLRASANVDDNHAIARQFLTPKASALWRPDGPVTVYDARSAEVAAVGDSADSWVLAADRQAEIGVDGGYTLTPGRLAAPFRVLRTAEGYRLAAVPPGLILTSVDITNSYRSVNTYFLDPTRTVVVPDHVLLLATQPGLATAMVRALLNGPTRWLAPAVVTAFPAGTRLLANVTRGADGVVDVNLSRPVIGGDAQGLSAQLVWTLRQLTEVSGVRLLVEGQPLPVPGGSQGVQRRNDWPSYDPDVLSRPVSRFFVAEGRLRSPDTTLSGPVGTGAAPLTAPAIAPGGDLVAGLVRSGRRSALYVAPITGRPRVRLIATALTAPSIDRNGTVWTVALDRHPRVVTISGSGPPTTVDARALFALGPVQALRVARDGTRVAAVVGPRGAGRLVVGVLVRHGSRPLTLASLRAPAPRLSGVVDISWADSHRLAVLARPAGAAARFPSYVEYDGSGDPTAVSTAGLPAELEEMAAAPGAALLVASGGEVWSSSGRGWTSLGPGTDPAYPG